MKDQTQMRFIATKSGGGTYETHDYIAGFAAGNLAGALESGKPIRPRIPVSEGNLAQVDLIAMALGYTTEVSESAVESGIPGEPAYLVTFARRGVS